MFLAGAFSGLVAGTLSNRYGRKLTMCIGGLCFIAGSVLQATAPEVITLVVGRILLGMGIGAANQVCLKPAPGKSYCAICYRVTTPPGLDRPDACVCF